MTGHTLWKSFENLGTITAVAIGDVWYIYYVLYEHYIYHFYIKLFLFF